MHCVSMCIVGTKIMKCLTVPTCCSSSNCPETDLKKAVGRTTEYLSRPCEVSAAFESASSNANLETYIHSGHEWMQVLIKAFPDIRNIGVDSEIISIYLSTHLNILALLNANMRINTIMYSCIHTYIHTYISLFPHIRHSISLLGVLEL